MSEPREPEVPKSNDELPLESLESAAGGITSGWSGSKEPWETPPTFPDPDGGGCFPPFDQAKW